MPQENTNASIEDDKSKGSQYGQFSNEGPGAVGSVNQEAEQINNNFSDGSRQGKAPDKLADESVASIISTLLADGRAASIRASRKSCRSDGSPKKVSKLAVDFGSARLPEQPAPEKQPKVENGESI